MKKEVLQTLTRSSQSVHKFWKSELKLNGGSEPVKQSSTKMWFIQRVSRNVQFVPEMGLLIYSTVHYIWIVQASLKNI